MLPGVSPELLIGVRTPNMLLAMNKVASGSLLTTPCMLMGAKSDDCGPVMPDQKYPTIGTHGE